VRLKREAVGHDGSDSLGAAINLEHLVAHPTVEMMVMFARRALVPRRLARQIDSGDRPLSHECLNRAIHSRDAELGHHGLRRHEDFLWREWAVLLLQDLADRRTLARMPLHGY
jgi:hypothetical protein